MRGNPFKEFLLFIMLWGTLLIPISLLSKEKSVKEISHKKQDKVFECLVTVKVTPLPLFFRFSQNEKVLWEYKNIKEHTTEKELKIAHDNDFADITFEAEFADNATGAFEINLSPLTKTDKSITVWGKGKFAETLKFSWDKSNG